MATLLTSGVPLAGQTVTGATPPVHYVDYYIPMSGASGTLTITFTDVTANPQLLVKFGSVARAGDYDYLSVNGSGQNESVTVTDPAAGDWYIAALKPLASINPGDVNPTFTVTATFEIAYDYSFTAFTQTLTLNQNATSAELITNDQAAGLGWNHRPDYEAHTLVCVDLALPDLPVTTAGIKIVDAHVTDLDRAFVFFSTPGTLPPVDTPAQNGMNVAAPAIDYYGTALDDARVLYVAGLGVRESSLVRNGDWHVYDTDIGNLVADTFQAVQLNFGGHADIVGNPGRLTPIVGFSRTGDDSVYFLKLDESGNIFRINRDTEQVEIDAHGDFITGMPGLTQLKGSFTYGVYLSQSKANLGYSNNRWGDPEEDFFDCDFTLCGHTVFHTGDRIVVLGGQERMYAGYPIYPVHGALNPTHHFHLAQVISASFPYDTTPTGSMRCTTPVWPWDGVSDITALEDPALSAFNETTYHNTINFPATPGVNFGWGFRLYKADLSAFTSPHTGGGFITFNYQSLQDAADIASFFDRGATDSDNGGNFNCTMLTRNAHFWENVAGTDASDRPLRDYQRGNPWIFQCRTTGSSTDAVDRLENYDVDFSSAFSIQKFPAKNVSGGISKIPQRMNAVTMADGRVVLVGGYYPCAGHAFVSVGGSFTHTPGWSGTGWSGTVWQSFVGTSSVSSVSALGEVLIFSGGRTSGLASLGGIPTVTQVDGWAAPSTSSDVWVSTGITGNSSDPPIRYDGGLVVPRMGAAVVAISADEIAVCGGFSTLPQTLYGVASAVPERSIEIYNLTTHKSRIIGYMNNARAFHTVNLINNHLLLVGGETLGPAIKNVTGFYPYEDGEYVFRDTVTDEIVYGSYELFSLSTHSVVKTTSVKYGPRRYHATTQIGDDVDGRKRFLVYVGALGWERLGYMVPYPVRDYGSQIPYNSDGTVASTRYFEPDFIVQYQGQMLGPRYNEFSGPQPGYQIDNIIPYIITLDFS